MWCMIEVKTWRATLKTFEFLTSCLMTRCIEKYRFNHWTRGRRSILLEEERWGKRRRKRKGGEEIRGDEGCHFKLSAPGHFFRGLE